MFDSKLIALTAALGAMLVSVPLEARPAKQPLRGPSTLATVDAKETTTTTRKAATNQKTTAKERGKSCTMAPNYKAANSLRPPFKRVRTCEKPKND